MTLLVEPEPGLAVRAVEDGVADAPRQPVHDDGIAGQEDGGDRAADDQRDEQRQRNPVREASGPQQVQEVPRLSSFHA